MPKLPTPLFDAVVKQLLPRVRTFDDRTALLTPLLNTERIYDDIKWEGTANAFATQLVERLQHEHLIALLRRLDVGAEQQADIEALCTQIAAAVSGGDRGGPDPYAAALAVYRRGVIALWSQPRFQIDTRFVRITLLVDQGRDAQGTRFVEPPGAREYNDLRELLKDIDDPAVVLLGAPGSGKTTLLRRLQLDEAGDRLADGGPSVSFFISLNRYALGAPEPDEWLAGEWNTTHPDLPPFDDLRRAGRLLLLLDALNEMPHRDDDDLAARIDHWRDFLRPFTECGNRIVFTCRSLDYSMPLSSPEVTVRQATLKPMTPGQIHEFLQVYVPDQAESV